MKGKTNALAEGTAKIKITTIRINQTITDPASMITRIVDEGGIEAIRANSHRYVGLFEDGVMKLMQLDDTDGTKFVDGTDATEYLSGTGPTTYAGSEAGGVSYAFDVWMKLPRFWWKCTQYATDQWDFSVAYGAQPDSSYKEWDGKDLIGVYEANAPGNGVYSISGAGSTGYKSQADFKTDARNRGTGFSLVKWKHHCMMAMLFYTQYGHTNCQAKIGAGTGSYDKTTGATNSLGMTDTVAGGNGDSQSVNFWGLENWWGNKYEWMDNIVVNARSWVITEDDGSTRTAGTGDSTSGYITKMLFGENIDLIPTGVGGSENTGFCDYYYQSSSDSRVVRRSGSNADAFGGVAYVHAYGGSSVTGSNYGSRLAFRGDYVIT